jgi:Xaa-Pro aminopeptidase
MANRLTAPLLLIGSPGDPSDLRYKTGFVAVDPMVFLDAGPRLFLVVPALELGRAKKCAPAAEVFVPQELKIPKTKRRHVDEWALGLVRHLGLRRVAVAPTCPVGVCDRLRKAGVRVSVTDEAPYPGRAIKTDREIRRIAEAQRGAVAAMKVAIEILRRSRPDPRGVLQFEGRTLTSERVRQAIDIELLRNNCSARDTIIAGGVQATDPHDRGSGPLRAGEAIVIDIFPQHKRHGYWGDITRTVVKGKPSRELRALYAAVQQAQRAALAMIRPGVAGRDVHAEVNRVFTELGYVTSVKDGVTRGFFHGTGHGVGLDIHEAPSLSLADGTLREGHVVTVEPGLYYPEIGGVRIEDTVVVTKSGWRYLATCPRRFEV